MASQQFDSSSNWQAPANVFNVTVQAWGGGGTGGGATGNPSAGGGGAGGQYVLKVVPVTPGNTYTVTVGAAATGSTTATVNGNDSWFDSTATVIAKGGAGAPSTTGTGAGANGSTTGGIGDVVNAGGNGATAPNTGAAGGGGEGGRSTGTGGSASGSTGGTGGDGGDGAAGPTAGNVNGNAGTVPGGGGSGARAGTATDRAGGDGAAGRIILTWSVLTSATPANVSLTVSTFAPVLQFNFRLTPPAVTLSTTTFAPQVNVVVTPGSAFVSTARFAPLLQVSAISPAASLTVTGFAPSLRQVLLPASTGVAISTAAPSLHDVINLSSLSLALNTFAPDTNVTNNITVVVDTGSLTLTAFNPRVKPFRPVFLDPGGDAVQAVGYFNTIVLGSGNISFDSTQKVAGVGSWKFDSGDGSSEVVVKATGVLGTARRINFYWRYDSVPDAAQAISVLVGASRQVYSGDGMDDAVNLLTDDGTYATASPARNAGQGTFFYDLGLQNQIPSDAIIDAVRIVYKRKYDTDTSIGTSRVKYRVNSIEGLNHDNTDQPLVDTVVIVDITDDHPPGRGWERQDLSDGVFEVIVEARRGDTDTAHVQSWDYVKVEVDYHQAASILVARDVSNNQLFIVGADPRGEAAVLRFVDGNGAFYNGITPLPINTQNRISLSYVQHDANDLDVRIYVNGIEELSIEGAAAGGLISGSDLLYGWVSSPGVDHLCWFDQIYIDNGDDLTDTVFGSELRVPHCTAKLPATVNDDEWNTTVGTGAVDERPLNLDNHRKHTAATTARQNYTLQNAATGDIDLSGKTMLGYMGWAWTKMQSEFDTLLTVNGAEIDVLSQMRTVPSLVKYAVSSSLYPSAAAGIGLNGNEEGFDIFMYECGVVVAYEGPVHESLLPYQLLMQDSITDLIDDLRADPPDSYELCYRIDEGEAMVLITVHSILSEGESPQLQGVTGGQGGSGRMRVVPGIEVQVRVEVTGGNANVAIWRRLNVD